MFHITNVNLAKLISETLKAHFGIHISYCQILKKINETRSAENEIEELYTLCTLSDKVCNYVILYAEGYIKKEIENFKENILWN